MSSRSRCQRIFTNLERLVEIVRRRSNMSDMMVFPVLFPKVTIENNTSIGIPVDLGAKFRKGGTNLTYEGKQIPDSFVFAYRLREIRYFKKHNFDERRIYETSTL